jgi:hypothetical protein
MTLRPRSKYNARKTVIDGVTFDSVGEANRWRQLKLLQRAGVIKGLGEPHPSFPIVVDGVAICSVEMDFAYSENGAAIAEDWKGVYPAMSRLKHKLLAAKYPHLTIRITGPGAPKPRKPRKAAAKAKGGARNA